MEFLWIFDYFRIIILNLEFFIQCLPIRRIQIRVPAIKKYLSAYALGADIKNLKKIIFYKSKEVEKRKALTEQAIFATK